MKLLAEQGVDCPATIVRFSPMEAAVFVNCFGEVTIFEGDGDLKRIGAFSTGYPRIFDMSCHPRQKLVAVVGMGSGFREEVPLRVWRWPEGMVYKEYISLGTSGHRVKFSPDNKWLVAVGSNEVYHVISLDDDQIKYQFPGGENNYCIDFHPDGKTIMTASWSQADTNLQFCELETQAFPPGQLPDVNDAANVEAYDLWRDDWESRFIDIPYDVISGALFSPDGCWIAVSHYQPVLYSYPQKQCIHAFDNEGRRSGLWKASGWSKREKMWSNPVFTPDSRTLICGSPSGTIFIWDVHEGRVIKAVPAHDGSVLGIALRGDGKSLFSRGIDKTLKLWQLDD